MIENDYLIFDLYSSCYGSVESAFILLSTCCVLYLYIMMLVYSDHLPEMFCILGSGDEKGKAKVEDV